MLTIKAIIDTPKFSSAAVWIILLFDFDFQQVLAITFLSLVK